MSYFCLTNPDCAGYHQSKHQICNAPDLFKRLAHMEHDFATQPNQTLYAEAIGEAANRIKRLEAEAARYRYLRSLADNYTTEWDHVEFSWRSRSLGQVLVPPSPDDVDKAIDAVMPSEPDNTIDLLRNDDAIDPVFRAALKVQP